MANINIFMTDIVTCDLHIDLFAFCLIISVHLGVEGQNRITSQRASTFWKIIWGKILIQSAAVILILQRQQVVISNAQKSIFV